MPYKKVFTKKLPYGIEKSWKRLRSRFPERKEYILYMEYYIQKNEKPSIKEWNKRAADDDSVEMIL